MKDLLQQELKKNNSVFEQLKALIASKHVVHAFLFSGGSYEDRLEIGNAFAKLILGRFEDFIVIDKPEERATIGTSSISELQRKLSYAPFGDYYVVLITKAELLTPEAQNKLLKTLEEPRNARIILLSEQKDSILPTVLSRCSTYTLEEAEVERDEELSGISVEVLDLLSSDFDYYRCKQILDPVLNKKDGQREYSLEFLDILEENALCRAKEDYCFNTEIISAVELARKYIKQGHNVAYSLKQMCLGIQIRR